MLAFAFVTYPLIDCWTGSGTIVSGDAAIPGKFEFHPSMSLLETLFGKFQQLLLQASNRYCPFVTSNKVMVHAIDLLKWSGPGVEKFTQHSKDAMTISNPATPRNQWIWLSAGHCVSKRSCQKLQPERTINKNCCFNTYYGPLCRKVGAASLFFHLTLMPFRRKKSPGGGWRKPHKDRCRRRHFATEGPKTSFQSATDYRPFVRPLYCRKR